MHYGICSREEDECSLATFHFPSKKEELLSRWIKLVGKTDWAPTNASVFCENHFKEEFLKRGKRTTLKWDLNPVPTIHNKAAMKRPAYFPEIKELRKSLKIRNILPDQMKDFYSEGKINAYEDIDHIKHCPQGYEAKKNDSSILFYRTDFYEKTDNAIEKLSFHGCLSFCPGRVRRFSYGLQYCQEICPNCSREICFRGRDFLRSPSETQPIHNHQHCHQLFLQ